MTIDEYLQQTVLTIKVKPNAPKTEIYKLENNTLHISIKAAPDKGKANDELVRFLTKRTGKTVTIMAGHSGRKKMIRLEDP